MSISLEEHFNLGVSQFLSIAAQHRAGVLGRLAARKKTKLRGVHLVEVQQEWLGKEVENGDLRHIWSKDQVDGVEAKFVQRKRIKVFLPGIQKDLLAPLLEKVDSYDPRSQIVFFIFVSGPDIKRAHIHVI